MANDLKGETALVALGQTWTLKLPFSIARRLKAEEGIDLLNEGLNGTDKLDVVLHAMLQKAHPDVTLETALEILDETGLQPVIEAMTPALAGYLGVSVETLKRAAKDTAKGTGENPQ